MIVIRKNEPPGNFVEQYTYVQSRSFLAKAIMPITRRLRAVQAERYMPKTMERHIDVGCGDGYFLKRSYAF